MKNSKVNDLQAFIAVAQNQSFTKAAARLGVTPSALSHTIKGLEERLGIRLLARTTRNVAPTEAGERLLRSIAPLFDQIAMEVEALGELRDKPSGTIRITCTDDQIELCLRPMLAGFLKDYPDITLEFYVDYGFTNVVEQRFDAGIRLGEAISKDMIAARIGPDWRLAVVGSPAYFEQHPLPETPYDLTHHACVNIRHRPTGAVYAWEFEHDGKEFTVKTEGQLVFNSIVHVLNAAVDGIGLAYVPEQLVAPYLADGRLKEVLTDWCPSFQGYHLYYPNRRQTSPAFLAFVEALRYRG
ncbi:LysR family transcriptional regulator [Pseudomonas sp. G11-1]|uniref:LysR family transcriptional regulator n=1 Tax=Halopseudomonas bauzanensis TaxID=653930 RepID=A0A4U0YMV3_9GAMM|nr:LysR family transcriptional regulator [Halopseudomonas bauzanensis]EZQ17111.1 LysR family transcriptional regulator [Halopseudomonas bauzanensis]MCO5785997.1 LysR family transcriptional regulator [Pseudomonas sp. G11-1]MCO5789223.1 LysR family transcriptional regulator [Pseudomonas sp. G11-2]TKA90313.1 LysR family transcriptional regulator [Halopseudomonas bauzanensis]